MIRACGTGDVGAVTDLIKDGEDIDRLGLDDKGVWQLHLSTCSVYFSVKRSCTSLVNISEYQMVDNVLYAY